jgi:hypothetical protein
VLRAGATEVNPVGEANGWRIGRLADPAGHLADRDDVRGHQPHRRPGKAAC